MRRHQVEWRERFDDENADPGPWRRLEESPEEGATDVPMLGLTLNALYDVRTRLVDEDTGQASDWVLTERLRVEKDSGVPPAVHDVRMTKENCLTWEMPMEVLDLRGFLVRHAPGIHDCWERAEKAHEEIVAAPPFVLCRVPKGLRTYLVRAVDWDGNESPEALITHDRGDIDDQGEFREIRTQDEVATQFADGLVQGATVPGPTLTSNSVSSAEAFLDGIEPTLSIDPDTPAFSDDPEAPFFAPIWGGNARGFAQDGTHAGWGGLYHWIEYVWSFTVHCGEEGPRSVLSIDCACTGEGWRLQYRVHDDLPGFSADPFAPGWQNAAGDPAFQEDPARRVWKPWPGRLLAVQPGRYDFRLIVPGGHRSTTVSRLSVSLSSEARVRHVTGLVVPALGGTRVPPGDRWRKIVDVRPLPVGVQVPTDVPVESKSGASGPSLRTFQGGAAATAVVDVVVRGY